MKGVVILQYSLNKFLLNLIIDLLEKMNKLSEQKSKTK